MHECRFHEVQRGRQFKVRFSRRHSDVANHRVDHLTEYIQVMTEAPETDAVLLPCELQYGGVHIREVGTSCLVRCPDQEMDPAVHTLELLIADEPSMRWGNV